MTQNSPNYLDNSAFVTGTKLQWCVDSTSLAAMDKCPRYYQLAIIEGWEPKVRSHHLEFGIYLHASRERYYHARADGKEHDEALREALAWVIQVMWDYELNRPWVSGDPNKNRETLVRTLIWYCDQWRDDPMETIILANGEPAVELTFQMPTDFEVGKEVALGEARAPSPVYVIAGHLDRLGRFAGSVHPNDLKTTKHTLNASFFDQFTPHMQMSLYSLASRVVWGQEAKSIVIDAVQIAVTFSRFLRWFVGRTQAQLDEWYRDIGELLRANERHVAQDYWPQRPTSCFRCDFRTVCSKSPNVREQWLRADFVRRRWNPLEARGDV